MMPPELPPPPPIPMVRHSTPRDDLAETQARIADDTARIANAQENQAEALDSIAKSVAELVHHIKINGI